MSKTKIVYIYFIGDMVKKTGYIGQTINPDNRLKTHLRGSHNGGLRNWLKAQSKKKEILLTVLELATIKNWQACERRWIKKYTAIGFNLFNATPGGEGWPVVEIWTRKALSIAHKERLKNDPKALKRLQTLALGRKAGAEERKRRSVARTGRKQSMATRHRNSLAHRGLSYPNRSAASRKRTSKALKLSWKLGRNRGMTGRKHRLVTKRRQSEAAIGRKPHASTMRGAMKWRTNNREQFLANSAKGARARPEMSIRKKKFLAKRMRGNKYGSRKHSAKERDAKSIALKAACAKKTPEQLSERVRKAWITRRKKKT